MPTSTRLSLCCVVTLCLTSPLAAETGTPLRQAAPHPARTAETLTGKERLGPKWTDEQRIDNCNVPADKRGTKPRPLLCSDPLIN
jgi:hypothetical protein